MINQIGVIIGQLLFLPDNWEDNSRKAVYYD
jgi:hypothetical protein